MPELAARQDRPLYQRVQLCPRNVWVNATAETTVGRGDHPFPAHQIGEAEDSLRDQLWMLDHIGGMADDTRQHQLVVGQLYLLPDLPLMLVTNIAGFERIRLGLDRQHDRDDVPHRDIGHVRTVPATPAQVEPNAILRQAADRMVERLDPN